MAVEVFSVAMERQIEAPMDTILALPGMQLHLARLAIAAKDTGETFAIRRHGAIEDAL